MKTLVWIGSLALLVSCNDKTKVEQGESPIKSPADEVAVKTDSLEPQRFCYAFVQQKDTIALTFEQTGAEVSGDLAFKNYQKDSSHGPVQGQFSADTLKLLYTSESEGMTSKREMRFLRQGLSLKMGIGNMDEKGDTMVFTKPSDVKYTDAIVLVRTECKD